jgi:hypothetical protein
MRSVCDFFYLDILINNNNDSNSNIFVSKFYKKKVKSKLRKIYSSQPFVNNFKWYITDNLSIINNNS